MYLNFSPTTLNIKSTSFEELLNLAAENGFEGIDLPMQHFQTVDQGKKAAEAVASKNMKWGLFYLPGDFLQVDDKTFETGLKRLAEMLPIVKAAGVTRTYNHVWSGDNERDFETNYTWHIKRLKTLVDLLGEYDVRMGLEFIGAKTLRDSFKYPFIYSINQAVELADAVSPDLGIIIDTYHWYTSGGTIEDIKACLAKKRIINVHTNDADPNKKREEQEDLFRAMPLSTGVVDVVSVLKTLKEHDYDGPVICEPFLPTVERFGKTPASEVAAEVSTCMKTVFSKVGIK